MKPAEAPARPDSPRAVLGAVVVLVLVLLAIAAAKSHRDLAAARQQERRIEGEIAATEQRIDRLRGRIERLRDDPATLERLAREDLGLVRPGDVVIVLPAEDARPEAPSPLPAVRARNPAPPPAPPS